ncbi:hypothetical protein GCM10023331_29580 [Algivirga pacifica]|uniref:histidine kinase n=2 Tax=Algivirga pacifica TaxID=1162670 RepID=A0ABP9DFL3_9BACT
MNDTPQQKQLPFHVLEAMENYTPSEAKAKLDHIITSGQYGFNSNHHNTYWLKVPLHEPTPFDPLLVIPGWGSVEVWNWDDLTPIGKGGHVQSITHYLQRDALHIPASTTALLVRLRTEVSTLNQEGATVQLHSAHSYELLQYRKHFIQALFIGIVLIMAMYNFLIFITIRDISYLYYVLSITGIGLYMMFFHGLNRLILWPNAYYWDAHSFAFIVPLTGIARTLFTRKYLHLKEYLPLWDKGLYYLLFLYFIPISLGLVSYFTPLDLLQLATQSIAIIGGIVLISMIATAYMVYQQGYRPARYFMVANFLFVIGALLLILQEVSLLPNSPIISYTTQIGVVAQVILFSLGLASRLKLSQEQVLQRTLEKERLEREKEREKQMLIASQKAELKREVEERTEELAATITQLSASEASLKRLNTLKDRLFSIISHDLRSPLATFGSFMDLLLHHSHRMSEQELQEVANETNHSLQALFDLLDNLLHWSRMQMQTQEYEESVFDIRELLDKNNSLYTSTAKSKNIQLIIEEPNLPLLVQVDRSMIDFVIRNLLNNAIKFTPREGKVTLSVHSEGDQVIVRIQDTGVGIPNQTLMQLLTTQEHLTTKGTEGERGTGLGLTLCRDFLQKNNSNLQITSEEGVGSTFFFELKRPTKY